LTLPLSTWQRTQWGKAGLHNVVQGWWSPAHCGLWPQNVAAWIARSASPSTNHDTIGRSPCAAVASKDPFVSGTSLSTLVFFQSETAECGLVQEKWSFLLDRAGDETAPQAMFNPGYALE
jgi:hypothetical protein